MTAPRRLVLIAAVSAVLVLPSSAPAARAQVSPVVVPEVLAGLKVFPEVVAPPEEGSRPQLLADIQLYSLRHPDGRLDATLQVGRFRPKADVGSAAFRRAIAARVGDAVPVAQRLGGVTVYLSQSKQLALAVWFRGATLFILSIRADAPSPKAMIRAALEIAA